MQKGAAVVLMKRIREKEEIVYVAGVILFLVISYLYGIKRVYGFSLFPDEFGYWASAARLVGYDWSAVSSLGSYYSFGYSLILAPILCIFRDALWAYRAAVTVNAILLVASFFLMNHILGRLLPDLHKKYRIVFAGIAICYPTWFLYMNMTLTEIVLVFTVLLVCDCLLRFMATMRFRNLFMTALATGYLYTIHMRTVAIVLAVVLTVIVRIVMHHKKDIKKLMKVTGVLLVILVVGIMGVTFVKELVQAQVYSQAEQSMLAVNDYAGQWHKVRSIFTLEGIGRFIVSLIAKVFYLGMASFGLFYYGLAWVIKQIWNKEEKKEKRCFYLFLLLAVIGQILICAIYAQGYGRIDALLYGRYNEHVLPLVMALGCVMLVRGKHVGRILIGILLSGIPAVALIEHVIVKYGMTNIHEGYFISGMSYLLRHVTFEPENYFWKAFVLSALFCLVLYGVFWVIRKHRELLWILCVVIGVECLLGLSLGEYYTFRYNALAYADLQLGGRLGEMVEESGRRIVSYGNSSSDHFISSIQFVLRDEHIVLIAEDAFEELQERDLVLVSGTHGEEERLLEYYAEQKAYGSFWLYYNE